MLRDGMATRNADNPVQMSVGGEGVDSGGKKHVVDHMASNKQAATGGSALS